MRLVFLLALLVSAQAYADPFSPSRFLDDSQPWHEPASRAVDVQHLDLTLSLDPAGLITGHAIYSGVLRAPATELRLDAADFAIDDAAWLANGQRVATKAVKDHGQVRFDLPQTEPPGGWQLELKWHARPKRGLTFVQPDADAPQRPQHVWSQGETEEARYWLPSPDDPDERLSWNVTIVAPAQWQALSNGEQIGRTVADKIATTQFAFKQEAPIYLLNVAAGPFVAIDHPHLSDFRCLSARPSSTGPHTKPGLGSIPPLSVYDLRTEPDLSSTTVLSIPPFPRLLQSPASPIHISA